MTSGEPASRHRRPGKPLGTIDGWERLALIYVCLLFGCGAGFVGLVIAHDEAWWWLKALAGFGVVAVLAGLGAWIAKSMTNVMWTSDYFRRKTK